MKSGEEKALTRERILFVCYLAVFFCLAAVIALLQPHTDTPPWFGNPPDEPSRYLVSRYICRYGRLPNGFDEEIRIPGYGISYGFYTMLPYIVQGFVMRFVNLFTSSELILLYTARFVNVCTGTAMAALVYGIGRRIFQDSRFRWLFCVLVMYLPQSLFLHTYVNTDSMSMFSTALIAYALVRACREGFTNRNCLLLAAGIVVCALSYYNAYGCILSSILLFLVFFARRECGKLRYDYREMLRKGCLISAVVLLGIGWYFIRNALLYEGDFLGLETLKKCGEMYGNPPYSRSHAALGIPLKDMLFQNPYFSGLINSFIASYGSMAIYAGYWTYLFYKIVFVFGLLGGLLPRKRTAGEKSLGQKLVLHTSLLLWILVPVVLCIYYAYTMDYQYQGRYVMPGVIPFMYYVTAGLERWAGFEWLPLKGRAAGALPVLKKLGAGACYAAIGAVILFLLRMIFFKAVPVYLEIGYVL